MALKGTLRDFGLADIFQLIGIQRKTGVLVLVCGGRRVTVSFLSGAVVSADSSERALEDRLGTVLVKSGKITAKQLADALKQQKQTLQRLGAVLIEHKAISAEDLREALKVQVTQIVHQLFRWRDGSYDFSQEETIDYDREHFSPIAAETILMEGARMVDEWPIIERRIRSYDLIVRRVSTRASTAGPVSVYETDIDFDLVKTGKAGAEEKIARLEDEEALVYGLVDGRSTVQDIIDRSHLGEFETCRILYELMSRELVQEGVTNVARARRTSTGTGRTIALRLALFAMSALAVLSLFVALESPLAPIGGPGWDPFAVNRIRVHLSQSRVGRIDQALRIYNLERQALPESLQVLVQDGFLLPRDLIDPWGRAYIYDIDASGYSITGFNHEGAPDRTVSLQSQFVATQRLALEGGVQTAPVRR